MASVVTEVKRQEIRSNYQKAKPNKRSGDFKMAAKLALLSPVIFIVFSLLLREQLNTTSSSLIQKSRLNIFSSSEELTRPPKYVSNNKIRR